MRWFVIIAMSFIKNLVPFFFSTAFGRTDAHTAGGFGAATDIGAEETSTLFFTGFFWSVILQTLTDDVAHLLSPFQRGRARRPGRHCCHSRRRRGGGRRRRSCSFFSPSSSIRARQALLFVDTGDCENMRVGSEGTGPIRKPQSNDSGSEKLPLEGRRVGNDG